MADLKMGMQRMNTRLSLAVMMHMDSKVWYERLNLVGKAKRFCQRCAGSFWFWMTVAAFTLAEPVLCSYQPKSTVFWAQVAVLAVSSILYAVQIIGVATREWDKILLIQALSSSASSTMFVVQKFTFLKLLVFFTAEGEYILEFCCLLGGWLAIFVSPGVATLRCFRVFRLLWFYDVTVFKTTVERVCNPLVGADFVSRCFKVLRFAIKALTALGNEMFRLTNATRGGLLLMLMLFFSAFVLGTATWIETREDDDGQWMTDLPDPAIKGVDMCHSRFECVYTLLRLSLFDGAAFDFIYFLNDGHPFLFVICIVYLCLTSFGILNGMVGIFGTAFQDASDRAFQEQKEGSEDADSGRSSSGSDCSDSCSEDGLDAVGPAGEGEDGEERGMRTDRLAAKVFESFRGTLALGEDDGPGAETGLEMGPRRNSRQRGASGKYAQTGSAAVEGSAAGAGVAVGDWVSDDEVMSFGGGAAAAAGPAQGQRRQSGGVGRARLSSGNPGEEEEVWSLGADELAAAVSAPDGPAPPGSKPPRSPRPSDRQQQQQLQQELDCLSPRDKVEVQRKLAGKLGAKSQFTMLVLKQMAAESSASPPAPRLRKGPSFTGKPVELRHGGGGTGKVVPFERAESARDQVDGRGSDVPVVTATLSSQPHQHSHHSHHHQGHRHQGHHHSHHLAAAGMFAHTRNQKSSRSIAAAEQPDRRNPYSASLGLSAAGGHHQQQHHHHHHATSRELAQQATDIKALTLNVQSLTRTVETQNELILTMFQQLKQLQQGHRSAGVMDGEPERHRFAIQPEDNRPAGAEQPTDTATGLTLGTAEPVVSVSAPTLSTQRTTSATTAGSEQLTPVENGARVGGSVS